MPARPLAPLLAVLALAAGAAGCGSASTGEMPPSKAQAQERLTGAPAPLAELHHQANDVLPGGRAAFDGRLRALRGRPVVVNKWASWCAPCRYEFPVLQRVSVRLGKQVAFVGLNSRDKDADARRYLRATPLSYPSYADPDETVAASIRMPEGFPLTNFYDRGGKLVYQHAGPYANDRALERDIRKYARQ